MSVLAALARQSLALFLCVTGGVTLVLARRIPETAFQSEFDPGPRAIPMVLGMVLLLGGMVQGWREARPATGENVREPGLTVFGILLGGLVLYVALMPYLGFALSTLILMMLMLWRLGSRWWVASLFSLGVVAAVQVLFGTLFKVSLPSGMVPLPFL